MLRRGGAPALFEQYGARLAMIHAALLRVEEDVVIVGIDASSHTSGHVNGQVDGVVPKARRTARPILERPRTGRREVGLKAFRAIHRRLKKAYSPRVYTAFEEGVGCRPDLFLV